MQEERKLVKIQFNKKTGQCHVSIPRAFWDSVTGTGYLLATLQDGKLIYTPAPNQMKKDTKIPKFLQESDNGASAISSKTAPEKKELTKIKPDPSINREEEPNVWEEDDNSESTSD